MTTAETYFTVNLEGDGDFNEEADNGTHAWSEMKSLLRSSFTPTNKNSASHSSHRNDIDFASHLLSDENNQDVDIYNTLGLNLEKKFRFSSVFKPADDVDDLTAMIQATENNIVSSTFSELDSPTRVSNGSDLISDLSHGNVVESTIMHDDDDDERSLNELSVSSQSGERRSRNRGIWTGGESLSTNKLAMMLSDMQGRLNDGTSDNESVASHSSRSRSQRVSNGSNARPSSSDVLPVSLGIDLVEMHSLEPTSPFYNDNRPYYVQGGHMVEPNIEVKSIKRGGRITRGGGDSMADEVSSVTSSLSASSAGSRYRTPQLQQHRLGSGGGGLGGDSSMLTEANIARNNAATSASTLKAPVFSPAPNGTKLRSMTPNSLQITNKQQTSRLAATATNNGRSMTPSGTSSRAPFSRPVAAKPAPPLVGSALRRSLEGSAMGTTRPGPVNTPVRTSTVRPVTPSTVARPSTVTPSRAPPTSTVPRTTTPNSTRPATTSLTSTVNRSTTPNARTTTTPNVRTTTPAGRTAPTVSAPAPRPVATTSRSTTPTAVSRVSPVPVRSTTPVAVSRSTTPNALSRSGTSGTPATRTSTDVKPAVTSVRKPITPAPAPATPAPKSKPTVLTPVAATPVVSAASRRAAAAAAAASTPNSTVKPTAKTVPVVKTSTPASRSGLSSSSSTPLTSTSSVRTSVATPVVARKPPPSATPSPVPMRTPQAKTTLTPVSVRNSNTKTAATPVVGSSSKAIAQANTGLPATSRAVPSSASRSGGTPVPLKTSVSGELTLRGDSATSVPLALDIASEPMESPKLLSPTSNTSISSINYHALQSEAMTLPPLATLVSTGTTIYMPSLRHSSQTVISAMFLSLTTAANTSQKNLLVSSVSDAPVASTVAVEDATDVLDESQQSEEEGRGPSPSQVTLQLTRKTSSRSDLSINTTDTATGQTRPSSILKTTTSFISPSDNKRSPSSGSSDSKAPKGVTIALSDPVPAVGSRPMMNGRTYQSLHEVNNITAALKELSKSTSFSTLHGPPPPQSSTPPQNAHRSHNGSDSIPKATNRASVLKTGIAGQSDDAAVPVDLDVDCPLVVEEGEDSEDETC